MGRCEFCGDDGNSAAVLDCVIAELLKLVVKRRSRELPNSGGRRTVPADSLLKQAVSGGPAIQACTACRAASLAGVKTVMMPKERRRFQREYYSSVQLTHCAAQEPLPVVEESNAAAAARGSQLHPSNALAEHGMNDDDAEDDAAVTDGFGEDALQPTLAEEEPGITPVRLRRQSLQRLRGNSQPRCSPRCIFCPEIESAADPGREIEGEPPPSREKFRSVQSVRKIAWEAFGVNNSAAIRTGSLFMSSPAPLGAGVTSTRVAEILLEPLDAHADDGDDSSQVCQPHFMFMRRCALAATHRPCILCGCRSYSNRQVRLAGLLRLATDDVTCLGLMNAASAIWAEGADWRGMRPSPGKGGRMAQSAGKGRAYNKEHEIELAEEGGDHGDNEWEGRDVDEDEVEAAVANGQACKPCYLFCLRALTRCQAQPRNWKHEGGGLAGNGSPESIADATDVGRGVAKFVSETSACVEKAIGDIQESQDAVGEARECEEPVHLARKPLKDWAAHNDNITHDDLRARSGAIDVGSTEPGITGFDATASIGSADKMWEASEYIDNLHECQKVLRRRLLSIEADLQGTDVTLNNGGVTWSAQEYEKYELLCAFHKEAPVSNRTFLRQVTLQTSLLVVPCGGHGSGSAIVTSKHLRNCILLEREQREAASGDLLALSREERNAAYEKLASIYCNADRVKEALEADVPLLSSLRLIAEADSRLLREECLDTESRSAGRRRRCLESLLGRSVHKLPIPFGIESLSSDEAGKASLSDLPPATFRRLTRVVRVIETKVLARNSHAIGPCSHGLGALLLLHSSKPVVVAANRLGLCPSYTKLVTDRASIAKERQETPISELVDLSLRTDLVVDNFDFRKGLTTTKRNGKADEWHGAIVVAISSLFKRLVETDERHTPLTKSVAPKMSDLLKNSRVGDGGKSTRSGQVLFAGLCAKYSKNLLSSDPRCAVSIQHLIRHALLDGSGDSGPCETKVTLLRLFPDLADTDELIRKVMDIGRDLQSAGREVRADYAVTITGDNPLFKRLTRIMDEDSPPGQRNPRYEGLVVSMGFFHTIQALFGTVKHHLLFALLDGLAKDSGMSPGAQARLKDTKSYKQNLRFFMDAAVALVLRLINRLQEKGDESFSVDKVGDFNRDNAEPIKDALRRNARRAKENPEDRYPATFNLQVNKSVFTPEVASLGESIVCALEEDASRIDNKNVCFFSKAILKMLVPAVMIHFMQRFGQIPARNDMLKNFSSMVWTSRQLNYQHAIASDFIEKVKQPAAVFDSINVQADGQSGTVTGSAGRRLALDELQEQFGVGVTKEGAAKATESCILTSFYSAHKMSRHANAVRTLVTQPKVKARADTHGYDESLYDDLKYSSTQVFLMFERASGRRGGSVGLLSQEHEGMSELTNVIIGDGLCVTTEVAWKLVKMEELGVEAMDAHGAAVFHPWKAQTSTATRNTYKSAIGGFTAARAAKLKEKSTRVASTKSKLTRMVSVTLRKRALDLAVAESLNDKKRVKLIKDNIDLVSDDCPAIIDIGTGKVKKAVKSQTVRAMQLQCDELKVCDQEGKRAPGFLIPGYPPTPPGQLLIGIDGMIYIHVGCNHEYSLLVRMHVDNIAENIILACIQYYGRAALAIDAHFDDPDYVPCAKVGEQAARDTSRLLGEQNDSNGSRLSFSSDLWLESAPSKSWSSDVLANRPRKRRLVNLVGVAILAKAPELLRKHHVRPEVPLRLHGCDVSLTESAMAPSQVVGNLSYSQGPDGSAVLCTEGDVNRVRDGSLRPHVTATKESCWGVQLVATETDHQRNESAVSVGVRRFIDYESRVGEAEVRMISVLSRAAKDIASSSIASSSYSGAGVHGILLSSDSDLVPLSVIGKSLGGFDALENVIVKLSSTHLNVANLMTTLNYLEITARTFVILCNGAGNDFNNGTTVATPRQLVKSYLANREKIGDLETVDSFQKLFYIAFMTSGVRGCLLSATPGFSDSVAPVFFSSEWQALARQFIAYSTRTSYGSDVLPQLPVLARMFSRAKLWNLDNYWGKCLDLDLAVVTCGEEFGYGADFCILTTPPDERAMCRRTMQAMLPPKLPHCNCGRGSRKQSSPCCCAHPTTKSIKCSCMKAGTRCTERCGCTPERCSNSTGFRGANGGEQQGIDAQSSFLLTVLQDSAAPATTPALPTNPHLSLHAEDNSSSGMSASGGDALDDLSVGPDSGGDDGSSGTEKSEYSALSGLLDDYVGEEGEVDEF